MELGYRKEAPMATHYEAARKVAEQGEVAVVVSQPDRIATLAFPLRASDERFVYSPNGKVRAAALLCFMEEAHRQLAEEL